MSHPSIESTVLEISLLGGFGLRVSGREIAVSRKARALLAYLATNPGQPVTRDTVSDLLWSRRGADQQRHSLRQTLVELRRIFAAEGIEPLQADIGTLKLIPERVAVDAVRMREAAAGASTADWAEADRLYTGPFLHNFPAIAQGFDDWLGQERATWAERALEALARLADTSLREGDARTAVTLCERMLAIDPLREDNHRRLMTAYAAAGRRADAVRQYHACVTVLRHDLDVGPSRETEELFQRLRTGNDKIADKPSGFSEAFSRGPEPRPTEGPPWIAVLPFRAMGPDPAPAYFAEGLAEDIVCALASMREPVVISTNSTRGYLSRDLSLAAIGRQLNVRYIVTGNIRMSGHRLRLSVELAEAASSAILWASVFDTANAQLFDVQDEISASVAATLVPRVNDSELRHSRQRPGDASAYHLMLQARELIFRLERVSFEQAGDLLRRAMAMDPNYAPIQSTIADWFSLRIGQGWSPDPAQDTSELQRSARRAISLDSGNARALAILGHNRTILNREYDEALRLFDRALSAAPNDAESIMWSGPTFAYAGNASEAVRRLERAIALSPYDPFAFRYEHFLCIAKYAAREYDEAAHWGRRSLSGNPHYISSLRITAASLVASGHLNEAQELAGLVIDLQPDFRVTPMIQRQAFRDEVVREDFGKHMIAAGLPP